MRTLQSSGLLAIAAIALIHPVSLRADEAEARTKLASKGIRVTHHGLTLAAESALSKALGETNSLKRKLVKASAAVRGLEDAEEEARAQYNALLRQNIQLATELKSASSTNILAYNNAVGEIKANEGQLRLMLESRKESEKEIDAARQAADSARENYLQKVLDARAEADKIAAQYAELAKDDEAQAALREWNGAAHAELKFEPSRQFKALVKRLEALEKTVIMDRIPLRRKGGSLWVSVVLNGSHTHEMVVDTGCTLMLLPHKVAMECGVKIDRTQSAKIGIADGSMVDGKVATLDSVRVGQFMVPNVRCIVAPPSQPDAPLLLGRAFLSHFKFELTDSDMKLSQVDAEGGHSARRHKTDSHTPARKKMKRSPAGDNESQE